MAKLGRPSQRKSSKPLADSKQIATEPSSSRLQLVIRNTNTTNPVMALRHFEFEDLPVLARQRVYHFLGFPIKNTITLFTDKSHKNLISLRELYKVDLSSDGLISVPWNVSEEILVA
jgi:hypothetical protein